MSADKWTDDLLDRLATALESSTRAIQANSEALAGLRTDYRDTTKAILESVQRLTEVQADIIETMTAQQRQIRGLQTENRRLMDLVLNKLQGEDTSISP